VRRKDAHTTALHIASLSPEERNTTVVLLLPLMLVAASLATSQFARHTVRSIPPMAISLAPDTPRAVPPVALATLTPPVPAPDPMADVPHDEPERHEVAALQVPSPPLALDSPAPIDQPEAGGKSWPMPRSEARPPWDEPQAFGLRLAAAARAQINGLVSYSAKYQTIAYPMGDISPLEGACTDVVIRAYRVLGIDLQELVHQARVGSGDPSIDHRRTETLRKFFARQSASLPVTPYPEDYLPGDIVTYYRPFSRVSRAHIAIVSDVLAPTGRPMIVHNRGWGPQLEDALFVDRITGHYRFSGPASGAVASHPNSRRQAVLSKAK
jgi:uncharacterized protein YijF (DUF1287 family)